MKLRKEEDIKNGGYIIYCTIGKYEQYSWWSSPPKNEWCFDKGYLKDRYSMITTDKRAKEFSRLWQELWKEPVTQKQYYIVSNSHTEGYIRTFWRPKNNGYTINLDEARIYSNEDVIKKNYKLITKDNINEWGLHDNFFIAVEDVELLGKRMSCIMN